MKQAQSETGTHHDFEEALQRKTDKGIPKDLRLDRHVAPVDRVLGHRTHAEARQQADQKQDEAEKAKVNSELLD